MVFCLLACAMGAVMAAVAPVGVFALGLVAIAVVKAVFALATGIGLAVALVWSMALFGCGQVGYVAGMAALSALRSRRARDARPQAALDTRPSLNDPLLK